MAIIGSAYVELHALDTHLQRDIDKAMKKVKEPLLTLQSNVNLTPVREKIRVLREELKRNPLKFSAEVDLDRVHEHIDATYELYRENPLQIDTQVNRTPAEAALESIKARYGEMTTNINTNANTAVAEAQIGFAARNRRSNIRLGAIIDPSYQKALKGIAYTITGALPADKIKAVFLGLAQNLEIAAIGLFKTLTIVGSVSAGLLTLGANALVAGKDIGNMVGMALLAPAVFTGLGAAIVGTTLGWKGFSKAMTDDKELAKLPAKAQAAVRSLKGLGGEIRRTTQTAYWEEMGESVQALHDNFFPKLQKGLEGTGRSMGKWGKGFADALKQSAEDGTLDNIFKHVNKGLENASKGVQPFTRAMFHLSSAGSKYLDAMGTSLADYGVRFDKWSQKIIKNGDFDRWIATAKQNFQHLGSSIDSTAKIFSGLTAASEKSGGKGLREFAGGMEKIAAVVNGEPFQSKLITILSGARRGAEALSKGFGAIKKVVGDSTTAISGFLSVAGGVGGSLLEGFAKIFEGTGVGEGFIIGLNGMKKAIDSMDPTFQSLGTILGDLGEISGTLFQAMAPGLNNLMETLEGVIAGVKDGIIAAMPVFNEFIQNILQGIAPVIIGIAQAFGNLLKLFAEAPGPIQNLIMALGLVLLLKKPLTAFFDNIRGRFDGLHTSLNNTVQRSQAYRTNLADNFRYTGAAAGYAASAIGKSLGNVRDNFRLTGMMAGDAVRTTFGQLADKARPGLTTFGAGVKQGFRDSLRISPDIKDGLKRDIKEPFSEVGRAIAGQMRTVGSAVSGEMKMVGEHSKAYFQQLPDQARKTWQNLPQIAKEEFTGVKNRVTDATEYMGEKVRERSIYASKHLSDIGKAIEPAVKDVKAGSTAIANDMRAMISPVETAAKNGIQSVKQGYNGMVLAGTVAATTLANRVTPVLDRVGAAASRTFEPVATAASSAYSKVSEVASRVTQTVSDAHNRASRSVAVGYNNMVLASTVAGTTLGRNMGAAAGVIGTHAANISGTMGRAFTSVVTASTNAASAAGRAASTVGTAFSTAASNVRANFAPVGGAIRDTFSTIGSNMRPAITAVGELGRAAGTTARSLGTSAAAGVRGAAGGLMSMMGGPWGIALAAGALAVGAFAEAQANAKKKVDDLAGALDQQTGAMTDASKKMLAKDWLDVDASAWDDLWRSGRRNMEELARDTGLNSQKVTEALADPAGRDAFVENWRKIRDAAGDGKDITSELAGSVNMTKEQMVGLSQTDLDEMARQFEAAAETAKKAEEQVRAVAKATGANSVDAAILAKNYETLASKTSSANDKFSALKENLQLLSTEQEKKNLGEKGYQQTLRDTAAGIQAVRDQNNGLVNNLFDVKKGFDFTKQAGSDLHTTLKNQTDGILQIGTTALDTALKQGKGADEANRIALNAMAKPIADLKASLAAMGFAPAQIQGIIDTMNLMPKELTTALKADGSQAKQEAALTALASQAFAQGNYTAVLAALPDGAKSAIESALNMGGAFANKDYTAILEALDKTGPGKEAALAALLTVKDGKYVAELAANNVTAPAVDAANKSIIGVKSPPPVQIAAKDGVSKVVSPLQGVINRFGTSTAAATVTVRDQASGKVATIQQVVKNVKGAAPEIKITDTATGKVQTIQGTINKTKGITPTISISDRATSPIQGIQGWINGLRDKTVTITTVQNTVHTSSGGGKGANGGIVRSMSNMFGGSFPLAKVKAFANGGVEKHVAQISRGQTPFRVWSEPETGGEAYIPLSKAKRGRSTKILEEVARMFGMTLLKTKSYANGGVEGGKGASGGSSASLSTGRVSAAFVSTVAQEMMKDNRSLNEIGLNVVDGIIGGINSQQGKAVDSMTSMAGSLEDAVRKRLDIHSPSKTFLGLGKYIIDGLTVGIKSNVGQVHKQISTLANRIYVAASDIKKATGKSIGSSMTLLNRQKTLSASWKKMSAQKFTDQIVDYYQKTGKTGNRTLADIVRAREDVNYRLGVATTRLKNLQTARADVFKSVSNQIRGEYKLGTSIVGQAKPYIPKMKFSDVMNYTSGMATRLRAFNGKIAALRKKGIAPGLIQEVAMLGSIEGTSVADAMLQGTSAEVKNLNSQYSQVGAMSTAIGNTTADAMYKVGIDAQLGLVRGLQKDSASLTSAANRMTSMLVAQVKKNLGIRSPSRVFAELGRFTGAGFIDGLDQMQSRLDQRVDNFINLDPRQVTTTGTTGVTSSAATAGPSREITVNVHPSPGMDEVAVGKAAVRELGWQLLSQ